MRIFVSSHTPDAEASKTIAGEERFRATFENAGVGIAHIAPQGTWLLANRRLCQITGYLAEELLGRHFLDITHPDDREVNLAQLRRIQAGEIDSYSTEKRLLHKDRAVTWVRSTVSALRKADRSIAYLIKVLEDISEKKAAEITLQEREAQLRLALDAGQLGTWRWDIAKGNDAVQADARCWALFGLPSGAASTSEVWGRVIPAEDREVANAAAACAIDPANPCDDYACEYRAVHPDRTVVWLSAAGRAFFEPDPAAPFGRRPLFMTGTLSDVTEARRAETVRKDRETRARYFLDLEKQLHRAPTADKAAFATCKMLGLQLGATFAAIGELDAAGEYAAVQSTWSAGDFQPRLGRLHVSDSGYKRAGPLLAGEAVTIEDVSSDPRTADDEKVRAFYASLDARSSIEVPLMTRGHAHMLMFVAGAAPRVWTKAEAALVRGTLERVSQVAERMRAEVALRESEERFRGVFENAATGIAILDLQSGLQSCNPAFCQMLG
jgi:PAS domain S-box-containing protein